MPIEIAGGIFRSLDRELWIVTAAHGGHRGGLIATSVSSVSIVPTIPRIVVALSRQHRTTELVRGSRAMALHLVLADRSSLISRFGLQSGRDVDKFDGLEVSTAATGSPILSEAAAWLDCRMEAEMEIGDRWVLLGAVVDAGRSSDESPLTLHRWLKIAPTEDVARLREQMAKDAALDAAAIREWRTTKSP